MFSGLRSRLSYANVVATLALFLALTGGTAVALTGRNTVFSDDITNGQVKRPDVANNAVNGGKVADNALTGNDVASLTGGDVTDDSLGGSDVTGLTGGDVNDNSLRGNDLDESSLGQVPNAALASLANSANTATDASRLGGRPASEFVRHCIGGAVKATATVQGTSTFSSTYTTTGVSSRFNCAGGQVQARRVGVGEYRVRFAGLGATDGIGTADADSASGGGADNFVTVSEVSEFDDAERNFKVLVRDADGGGEDATFKVASL